MSDYKTGYKNPPQSGRFAKGTSGNPKGRPKGTRNIATRFNEIAHQVITVKENGRTKTMTRLEAVFHQMTIKAMSGDSRTMKDFINLSRLFEATVEHDDQSSVPHERDRAAFRSALRRIKMMTDSSQSSQSEHTLISEDTDNESDAE